MDKSKITTKGQVTIPKEIRDQVHFRPGDEVEFAVEGEKVVMQKKGAKERFMATCGAVKMTAAEHDRILQQIRPRLE